MRFIRYKTQDSQEILNGCLDNNEIHSIKGDPFGSYRVGDTVALLKNVKLLSPCVPTKVIGIAANYRGVEGVTENMKEPLIFLKQPASITGPYDDVVCPFKDCAVWGEPELGIVIGKRLSKATPQQAKEGIFGYVCANDITAKNVEGRDHHLVRSKGQDSFCPIGPWIDTKFDTSEADMEGTQNGKLIRKGNIKDRIWKEDDIVGWLSQWMSLEIGDIIITGTPARLCQEPYLKNGDIFEVNIEGLGSLRNRFVCKGVL